MVNLFPIPVMVIVIVLFVVSTSTPVQAQPECQIGDNDFFPLVIAGSEFPFAGKVIPSSRSILPGLKLILSSDEECNAGWRLETSGTAKLFHTSEDPDMCLQAGHRGNDIAMLTSGTKMRIYPCDTTNALQRFVWGNGECTIKPQGRDDLCMTWRGVVANLDVDPIILVECDKLETKRAAGWWAA